MRLWIKDPLAVLAEGAEGGFVVEGTRIVELVGRGRTPSLPVDPTFDASRHVVLPGLVNAHHHFYQTLVRAHPAGLKEDLVPWLVALYPIWARIRARPLRLAARMALVELLLSGCTTSADHHNLFPPGLENAIDIEVEEARALRLRMTVTRGAMSFSVKDGGLPPDNVVQSDEKVLARLRARAETLSRSQARLDDADRLRAVLALRREPADARPRRRSRNATIAGCTRISARSRTRSDSASRRTASGRWIF